MLYQRTVTLEETLTLILNLLTKEDRKKKESKEEKDELSSIPPIPNAMAARLLHMSTRQLQRVRRRYQLKWEERGREVFYHLVPLLKAISRLNLDGDNFIYGCALNLQAEFYLSDKIALTANVKGRFTFGSDVQIYHTTYGVGVKIIIE